MSESERTAAALAEFFPAGAIKFLPKNVKENRALALPYVDARAIIDRLDAVCGIGGWQDAYDVLPDGSVICTLRLRIGDEWIAKSDVGGQSKQPDGGDRLKAAFSAALKRAASKWGVGRYLYRVPAVWADYDPKGKRFVQKPQLPAAFLPESERGKQPAAKPAEKPAPLANGPAAAESARQKEPEPTSGPELVNWVGKLQTWLVRNDRCKPGELWDFLVALAKQCGEQREMKQWPAPVVAQAVTSAREFAAQAKKGAA